MHVAVTASVGALGATVEFVSALDFGNLMTSYSPFCSLLSSSSRIRPELPPASKMTTPELGGSELGSRQHFSDKLSLTKMREGEGSRKTFTVAYTIVGE